MPIPLFKYQDPFPTGKDDTQYYLLTKDHVSVTQFEGKDVLKSRALPPLTKLRARRDAGLLVPAPPGSSTSRWPKF